MKIELPQKKIKAKRVNPRKIIIFGKPKTGKTTILSELDNCLILDLEQGSEYVDATAVNIKELAEVHDSTPLEVLKSTIKELNRVKEKIGRYPYKFIAIDTVTELEQMVLPMAAELYRKQPMGANWAGSDVRKLPNGAGYRYLQDAFFFVINQIESVCDTLILVSHLKNKLINTEGKEMTEKGIDLTGKTSSLIAADADALGYIYRDENKTVLNFASSETLEAGARPEHLRGKQIVVAESDENGNINVDWSGIFLPE